MPEVAARARMARVAPSYCDSGRTSASPSSSRAAAGPLADARRRRPVGQSERLARGRRPGAPSLPRRSSARTPLAFGDGRQGGRLAREALRRPRVLAVRASARPSKRSADRVWRSASAEQRVPLRLGHAARAAARRATTGRGARRQAHPVAASTASTGASSASSDGEGPAEGGWSVSGASSEAEPRFPQARCVGVEHLDEHRNRYGAPPRELEVDALGVRVALVFL